MEVGNLPQNRDPQLVTQYQSVSPRNIHMQATLSGFGKFNLHNYSLCAHTCVKIILKLQINN